MKKYTIFSLTFIFGLFLMTNVIANDDHDKQKRPIAVNNLPEDVREAIQENYEGYRIQEAFIVTRNGDGAEGQREGVQRGTQREGTQQRGTQREGVQQGTERTGTQREGQTGTQREGVQQGTERTGTQREGQAGTQRGGTGHTGTQTERSGAERSDDEGILGGLFSSDDEDTYYEIVLAKGQESKTVKFNEDGDELDKDNDRW
jgi:hypothetical protein